MKVFFNMRRNGLILAAFAAIATALLMFTQFLTGDRIAEQQRLELLNTLTELIPESSYTNDLYADCTAYILPNILGSSQPQTIYRARHLEQPVALGIRTTAPDGYSGDIHLLIALTAEGTVLGARVLDHKETPGLGDKIELRRGDWILSFNHETVTGAKDARWAVRREGGAFDQFAGATITPRAIINAIHRTVVWAQSHQAQIFNAPINCQQSESS